MLKNLIKITLRNFRKQLSFSLLNVLGLTIGLTSFILVMLWVNDELSFESFHHSVDNIYRINKEYKIGAKTEQNPRTPYLLGPYLKDNLTQVLNTSRVISYDGTLCFEDKCFNENNIFMTESSFFQMFNFPLIRGDKNTCLDDKSSIVISQKIARKYFGEEDPIGKVLTLNTRHQFKVSAIAENLPENTHFNADIFIPIEYFADIFASLLEWGNHYGMTYVLTDKKANIEKLNVEFTRLLQLNTDNDNLNLKCQALKMIHFQGTDTNSNGYQYVYLFSAIGIFILLIACINYMNMSSARAAYRSKEIGVKKVFGASRLNISTQIIFESLFYASLSVILAMMFAELFRPVFNQITGKNLHFNYMDANFISSLIGITLLTAFLSGSYPSYILTKLNPIIVLKGFLTSTKNAALFRKVLVIFQFCVAIILIISTLIVYSQLNYINKKDLGFQKENIIYFTLSQSAANKFDSFKTDLLQSPAIEKVGGSSELPNAIWSIVRDVKVDGMKSGEGVSFGFVSIDYDFVDVMGLNIAHGRKFSKDFRMDTINFIMNEKAIEFIGLEDPIGKEFRLSSEYYGHIIGVVENFNSLPLTHEIEPLIMVLNEKPIWGLIRVHAGSTEKAIQHLEKVWGQYSSKDVLDYNFLDKRIEKDYSNEKNMGRLSLILSIIAIIIECLGLLGLIAFMIVKRNKEVGIRKVLGSSIQSITLIFMKSFIIWVLIANIIAWPIAWLLAERWLENFAYSIRLNLSYFVIAGFISLFIALITISVQVYRAAIKNPIDSIKYE